MSSQSETIPSVKPIYLLEKNAPENLSVADICAAAEAVAGSGSIFGCTLIYGVWRIKPLQMVARAKLLANGIVIDKKRISLEAINPNYNKNGGETVGTRLTVSNLPFSYSNDAIMRNLTQLGVKSRSSIKMEKARGRDNKLTDWANGRRVLWISLPEKPLPKSVRMGDFWAHLYYREMKNTNNKCFNCLQEGHRAANCTSEVVCRSCKQSGHRSGDPQCTDGFNHLSTEDMESIWGGAPNQYHENLSFVNTSSLAPSEGRAIEEKEDQIIIDKETSNTDKNVDEPSICDENISELVIETHQNGDSDITSSELKGVHTDTSLTTHLASNLENTREEGEWESDESANYLSEEESNEAAVKGNNLEKNSDKIDVLGKGGKIKVKRSEIKSTEQNVVRLERNKSKQAVLDKKKKTNSKSQSINAKIKGTKGVRKPKERKNVSPISIVLPSGSGRIDNSFVQSAITKFALKFSADEDEAGKKRSSPSTSPDRDALAKDPKNPKL